MKQINYKGRVHYCHEVVDSEEEEQRNGLAIENTIPKQKRVAIGKEFMRLEKEVDDFIRHKQKQFDAYLDANGLTSSMGWICKKEKKK